MPKLKRTIGLSMLTLYGLGTILGAGIYVLVGKVAAHAGLYAPLAFLLAAMLATFSGYSYAKLSSAFPLSAGEAVYISEAFNSKSLSTLVGWMVVLTGVVSAATITNGFVGYLQVFVDIPDFWGISLLVFAMTGLAVWGVSESVTVTVIATVLGLIGLLMILWYSLPAFATLPTRIHEFVPPMNDFGIWFGVLLGAFLAFYAFIGFEDMVNMAEEVRSPESTLPKSITYAIVVSSLLYFFVALAAVLQLPLEALVVSNAPLADVMNQHSASAAYFISLISLAAIINGALVQIIMCSRVIYGMGNKGIAPALLAKVHPTRHTPYIATLVIGGVVWLLATSFELTTLAQITSFIIIVVFLLVNASLIRLVQRHQLHASLWVPSIGVFMCLVFISVQLYQVFFGEVLSH